VPRPKLHNVQSRRAEALRHVPIVRGAALQGWRHAGVVVSAGWIFVLSLTLTCPAEAGGQDRGRVRPPDAIGCSRDELTVYTGRVTSYRRRPDRLTLVIRTDADTTERVVVRPPAGGDFTRVFRLRGGPFAGSDWNQIESSGGRPRAGLRAAVWVCANGPVLVDWDAPKE
jgi:hypothetical protein